MMAHEGREVRERGKGVKEPRPELRVPLRVHDLVVQQVEPLLQRQGADVMEEAGKGHVHHVRFPHAEGLGYKHADARDLLVMVRDAHVHQVKRARKAHDHVGNGKMVFNILAIHCSVRLHTEFKCVV